MNATRWLMVCEGCGQHEKIPVDPMDGQHPHNAAMGTGATGGAAGRAAEYGWVVDPVSRRAWCPDCVAGEPWGKD